MFRLCQKELRESLRDRRTIITLVLMPLLVYPLLSMILQRLLLTTAAQNEVQTVRIGFEDDQLKVPLESALAFGRHILAVRGIETLSIERPDAPPTILKGDDPSGRSALRHLLGQDVELFHIRSDGRQALLSGAIDLLVRAAPPAKERGRSTTSEDATGIPQGASAASSSSEFAADDEASGDDQLSNDESRVAEPTDAESTGRTSPVDASSGERASNDQAGDDQAGDDQAADYFQIPGPIGSAGSSAEQQLPQSALQEVIEQIPQDRYALEYVPDDRHSEMALYLVRSLFAAINEELARQIIQMAGADYRPRITMSAAPIETPNSSPSTLASLVPLVLVLMTIAGAVYPAIDLTAGERERGTLEAMIVSPTPRPLLLLAKYVAVVTVALLTALANLLAMSITLWASGLGRMVFGEEGLSPLTVSQILCLLVLFSMFFSALLLSITSFAKSFKEAQAYLIPVMLVSLAPGVLSLLPQVRLTNLLAAVPLANIVLLSRDVLTGSASSETGLITVICTLVYALAAIAVASRLFGTDASLQGSQGSWRDLVRRPDESAALPTVDQMALTMACLFPLYFVASTSLPALGGSLAYRLWVAAAVSWALIFGLPTLVSYYRRLNFRTTFLLSPGRPANWLVWLPAVLLLSGSLWMAGHELMVFSQQFGFATFSQEQLKQASAFAEKLHEIPLAALLFVGAVTPAVCEEWFFRGFVLSALRRFGLAAAVIVSALLFGLMHVLTSNMLSVERLLPSTFMGLVLGLVAWKTQSLWPGVLLHMAHNSLLLSVGHFRTQLEAWGVGVEEGTHLPASWLLGGLVAALAGLLLIVGVRTARTR
jgi:ABC-2 type transport system permease protein/sodium transport system permease protein